MATYGHHSGCLILSACSFNSGQPKSLIHSSTAAWTIPRSEKPGGIQSTESQRVGHDWTTNRAPCPLHAEATFDLETRPVLSLLGTIVLFSYANKICEAPGLFLQMATVLTQLPRIWHKILGAPACDTIPTWDSCSQLKCNFHPLLGSTALHPSNSFLPKQVILTLGEAMTQWGNILHLHILNMEAERSSWCYGAHWTMKVCKWEDAFIFKTFLLDSPKRFYSTTLTFVILGTQLTGVSPALSWHLTTAAFCLCGVESFGYRTLSIFKVCETEALASI